jgi:hypothetical protein
MRINYSIEAQPTTWDVATWLVAAQTNGFTEVAFVGEKFKKKNNYPDEVARFRLENLVKPLIGLSDMKLVEEPAKDQIYMTHFMKAVFQAYRDHSRIWKFKYEKKHEHVTVTVRESFRNKSRDGNRPEWDRFIGWMENNGQKVVVIEDAEKNFISVKDRWDLYQCKMNFFTGGGPSTLCMFSDAPYVTFFKGLTAHDYYLNCIHHWLWTGAQFPWATKQQRIVWKEDKFDLMVKAFAASGVH